MHKQLIFIPYLPVDDACALYSAWALLTEGWAVASGRTAPEFFNSTKRAMIYYAPTYAAQTLEYENYE